MDNGEGEINRFLELSGLGVCGGGGVACKGNGMEVI